jgi:hypothetical protein
MKIITVSDVKKIFEDLINGRITRDEAENWAIDLCDQNDWKNLEYLPKNKKMIIWEAA